MKGIRNFLIIVALYLGVPMVFGAIEFEPLEVSRWPGYTRGRPREVAIYDHYAILASSSGAPPLVIDVGDPAVPRVVGNLPESGYRLQLYGSYLFYLNGAGNFSAVDLQDPFHPKSLPIPIDSGALTAMQLDKTIAYLGSGTNLTVLDVTIPTKPTRRASYSLPSAITDIEIDNHRVYVSVTGATEVIDVSDPAHPMRLGSLSYTLAAGLTAFSGDLLYLSGPSTRVIDISDLTNPRVLSSFSAADFQSFVISGQTAAGLSWFNSAVWLFDLADPLVQNPVALVPSSSFSPIYPHAATIKDSRLYIAHPSEGLIVVDISNLTAPRRLGKLNTLGLASDGVLAGNVAYLLDDYNGLVAFDCTNPMNPSPLGRYSYSSKGSLQIAGHQAYLLVDGGLQILDITNPAAISKRGSLSLSNFSVDTSMQVAVQGSNAFVCAWPNQFHVVDILNPTAPKKIVSMIESKCAPGRIRLSGKYAVVGSANFTGSGIDFIDVSNPAAPFSAGSLQADTNHPNGYGAFDVVTNANLLLIASEFAWEVKDISNPAAVKTLTRYSSGAPITSIRVIDHFAFITTLGYSGNPSPQYIFDISNPLSPQLVATGLTRGQAFGKNDRYLFESQNFDGLRISDIAHRPTLSPSTALQMSGGVSNIAIAGRYGIVATSTSLGIIDLTNPLAPKPFGAYPTGVVDVVVGANGLAFAACGSAGLGVFDIQNPFSPILLGMARVGGFFTGVAVSGATAFGLFSSGMSAFDVSNPASPTVIGFLPLGTNALNVTLSGNRAYVANGAAGLAVIDVSNPRSMRPLAQIDTSGSVHRVALSGTTAFIANGPGGLRILDVLDPAPPSILSCLPEIGNARAIALFGAYAYVGTDSNISVVNVANPRAPRLVAIAKSASPASLVINENFLYAADQLNGLKIFSLFPGEPVLTQLSGAIPRLRIASPVSYIGNIQRSRDLDNWSNWKTISVDPPGIELTDDGPVLPAQFYRLVVP